MGDNSLKDYLLNKTSTNFKRERYHLYMHIHSGSVERMNGIMVQFASGVGLITLSEISTYPVGLHCILTSQKRTIQRALKLQYFLSLIMMMK